MANRAQLGTTHLADVVAAIVTVIVSVVGMQMIGYTDQLRDPEVQQEICVEKFGEGASAINDTDNFDCKLPNGTVVEEVTLNLTGEGVSAG